MTEIKWNRTDLIDESDEVVEHQTKQQKQQLKKTTDVIIDERTDKRVKITKVSVGKEGEKRINKKAGTYISLTVPSLVSEDDNGFHQLEKNFIKYFDEMHKELALTKDSKVLVVGLGNKTITPDAIGPFTIDAMQNQKLEESIENFILYAPGVTGQTGFETSDFIKALADKIKPDLIIVIDALATKSSARLCKTIQITDTGIHPGSGVGNERTEVSKEVLGVPVTAIGIPTVVDATVIIADSIEKVFRSIASKIHEKGKPSRKLSVSSWVPSEKEDVDLSVIRPIFGDWSTWPKEERFQLFEEVLSAYPEKLIVTPKEVDIWITKFSILINNCLFKWLSNKLK